MDKRSIVEYLDERSSDFYRLSDTIWENAEIRFREKKSAEDYRSFLEKEGFPLPSVWLVLRLLFQPDGEAESPLSAFSVNMMPFRA